MTSSSFTRSARPERAERPDRPLRPPRDAEAPRRPRSEPSATENPELEVFHLSVGKAHGAQPGDIVGAIANEAELDSRYIGRIRLFDDYSTVELPVGMPRELMQLLKRVRVRSVPLGIRRFDEEPEAGDEAGAEHAAAPSTPRSAPPPKKKKKKKDGPSKRKGTLKLSGKPAGKPIGKPKGKTKRDS